MLTAGFHISRDYLERAELTAVQRSHDPPSFTLPLLDSLTSRVPLREETQQIIADLEGVSGYPVQVVPVSEMGVLATISTSPHLTGSYVIQFRAGIPFKDYVVAFQCGHVLRLLSLREAERFQFATGDTAMAWGVELVRGFQRTQRRPALPESVLTGFAEQLISGLFTQIRSIPIGMRIDAWLAADYPALAGEQAEAVAAQQQEALSCLSPQVRAMVPDQIVSASILLSAAYAIFCDRLLGTTQFQVPYAASGFKELGEALVKIFDDMPAEPSLDRALVDAWAREIGLDGKYTWLPLASSDSKAS